MEAVKNAVFTACLTAILISAVQTLSPAVMKKELRLVCGLVLIICVAAQISGSDFNLDISVGGLSDNADYLSLNKSFEQTLIEETEDSLEKSILEKLSENGIFAKKVSIVCSLDEYNCVKADRACIYLPPQSDDQKRSYAENLLKELLPETETEVIEN